MVRTTTNAQPVEQTSGLARAQTALDALENALDVARREVARLSQQARKQLSDAPTDELAGATHLQAETLQALAAQRTQVAELERRVDAARTALAGERQAERERQGAAAMREYSASLQAVAQAAEALQRALAVADGHRRAAAGLGKFPARWPGELAQVLTGTLQFWRAHAPELLTRR